MPRKKDEFMMPDEMALDKEIRDILNPKPSSIVKSSGSGQVEKLDLSEAELGGGSDPELETDLDTGLGGFNPKL